VGRGLGGGGVLVRGENGGEAVVDEGGRGVEVKGARCGAEGCWRKREGGTEKKGKKRRASESLIERHRLCFFLELFPSFEPIAYLRRKG
jgi:hypothetical protein